MRIFLFLLYRKITVNMRFFRRISVSRLRLNRKFQFVILEICLGTLSCMYYSWMRTSSSISVESDVSNVGSLAAKLLFILFYYFFWRKLLVFSGRFINLGHHLRIFSSCRTTEGSLNCYFDGFIGIYILFSVLLWYYI